MRAGGIAVGCIGPGELRIQRAKVPGVTSPG